MKILYLNSTPYDSEMANLIQVKAMCKAMAEHGFDVTLSLPGKKLKDSHVTSYYNVSLRKQLLNNKLDKYINIFSLIREVKRVNPDIIFIRDPLILLCVFFFTNKKMLFESHHFILHQGFNKLDQLYRWILKKSIALNRVKKLICISHALANYWQQQGISMDKILPAHDGIDSDMFINRKSKTEVRKLLSLPVDKTIVTYSGRLYKNRRVDSILKLASKFPDVYFLVVGGPDNNAKYFRNEAEQSKIDNINFTGQIRHETVPEYLAASDILLALWSSDVPTINFCSPLKLFEYMAANKTIIAHGFPTIKEVLVNDIDALLVEPDSYEDLVSKLRKALNLSDQVYLANNAFNKVLNYYTWEKRIQLIFEDL